MTERFPRIGLVGMWQETNTYSSRVTRLADFEAFELLAGQAVVGHHRGTGSVIGGFIAGLEAKAEIEPIFSAGAWPGGPADESTTRQLLGRLDESLSAAAPVDGILVNLHGAMVGGGVEDMEVETLRRIHNRYPGIPCIAVLDLHANFSAEACALCTAVVGYRTYPHVDMRECGLEAAAFMLRAVAGERFVCAYGRLAALTSPVGQRTDGAPMQGLVSRADQRTVTHGIERISLLPGFCYSDVARGGFTVVAVSTADQKESALVAVEATLRDVAEHILGFQVQLSSPEDAVRQALASVSFPIVLADVADNIGGGSPGDGTVLLAELLRQHASGAVVVIADRSVVDTAWSAGVGAKVEVKVGGKNDDLHGHPVVVKACVVHIGDGQYRASGSYMTGQFFSMGRTGLLETEDGIRIIVTERATPPFHLEQLPVAGVEPQSARIIVAKGAVAWRETYEGLMAGAIEVDTPGCCPADPYSLERRYDVYGMAPTIPDAM